MKRKNQRITDQAISDATHETIRQAGWTMPIDEESVAAAEARTTDDLPELPESLRDPRFPSAAGSKSGVRVVPLWDPTVLAAPMARAAREGGSVPGEVEEAMERDREIAERELRDRDSDGESDDRQ